MQKINFEDKVNVKPKGDHKQELWAEDFNLIKRAINSIIDAVNNRVKKVRGKGLSPEEFTKLEKKKLQSLYNTPLNDTFTSTSVTEAATANQVRVLKGFIDSINRLLTSDDTSLDELQEIVAYIKQNKSTLSTLSISNIAGLKDALSVLTTGKLDKKQAVGLAERIFEIDANGNINIVNRFEKVYKKSEVESLSKLQIADENGIVEHTLEGADKKMLLGDSLEVDPTGIISVKNSFVDEKIDKIEVGNFNLISNSNFRSDRYFSLRTTPVYGNGFVKINTTSGSDCFIGKTVTIDEKYIGKELTFSLELSADWGISLKLRAKHGTSDDWSNDFLVNNGDRGKLTSLTFTPTTTSITLYAYSYSTVALTLLNGFMLTCGNKAVRWSSCTLDIKTDIDNKSIENQIKIKATSHTDAGAKGVAVGGFYINSTTGVLTQRLT